MCMQFLLLVFIMESAQLQKQNKTQKKNGFAHKRAASAPHTYNMTLQFPPEMHVEEHWCTIQITTKARNKCQLTRSGKYFRILPNASLDTEKMAYTVAK